MDYVCDVLGLGIELVSILANLSHKALRLYRSDKWNPSLSTLVQVDQTLQKHMAAWVKDKNDTPADRPRRLAGSDQLGKLAKLAGGCD